MTINTCIINVLYSGREVNDETSWKSRRIEEWRETCHGIVGARVEIDGWLYLLSGDKKLIDSEHAHEEGIRLKYQIVNTTRFSPDDIARPIEGHYRANIPELYEKVLQHIQWFIFFTDE